MEKSTVSMIKEVESSLHTVSKNNEKKLIQTPGIFYPGGCCYMACRGLMLSPIEDLLVLTHGPTGCGFFSWTTGRRDEEPPQNSFYTRSLSTNLTESDVIFGGEEKLMNAIEEAIALFHPKAIAICATCPVGLIGDDIEQIASDAEEQFQIPIIPFSCEGFKSVQGWLLGGQVLEQRLIGTATQPQESQYTIHYMSESYVGKNKTELGALWKRAGFDVVCSMMGITSTDCIRSAHQAKLIVLDSSKQIDSIPQSLQTSYGCGFMRASFTGLSNILESMRKVADYFQSESLSQKVETVLDEELNRIADSLFYYRNKFHSYTAAIFEDCFKTDAFYSMLTDLSIDVILISQDYSCWEVTDENFTVLLPSSMCDDDLLSSFSDLEHLDDGRLRLLCSRSEVTSLLEKYHPSLCFAGITEQFRYFGNAVKSTVFNSEERGVQYGGFDGFLRFARDLEMAIFIDPIASSLPPWKKFNS